MEFETNLTFCVYLYSAVPRLFNANQLKALVAKQYYYYLVITTDILV
jgi:hypothetical protein